MEIRFGVDDDYLQGEREHVYTDDDDWLFEEDDDKVIRTKRQLKIKPRGR